MSTHSSFHIASPDGRPVVEMPNSDIPISVIIELDQILASGLSLEDAITNLKGHLAPPGCNPYPFRSNTTESLLDKLHSIVATYTFCKRVAELKLQGVDFTSHLYVPKLIPSQAWYTMIELTTTTFLKGSHSI